MINYRLLEDNLDVFATQFKRALPHSHLVIDNFLDAESAIQAYHAFPKMEEMDTLRDFRQHKAQDPRIDKFDPVFHKIIFDHLHSPRMMAILSKITGIESLIPDTKLYASGLAQSCDGGFLNVHLDNSSHAKEDWYRRLNLLIYLNLKWTEEKGGHLELWDQGMKNSAEILPIFNRMTIFATDKKSWHGHKRVNTPDGDTRKSINIYYFTEASPDGTTYHHVTSFRGRREEVLKKILYPVDNIIRSAVRQLRPNKDSHAVLYEREK